MGKLAKENNCYEEFDEVYRCPVLHEDKVKCFQLKAAKRCDAKIFFILQILDLMEDQMTEGGKIVDYRSKLLDLLDRSLMGILFNVAERELRFNDEP